MVPKLACSDPILLDRSSTKAYSIDPIQMDRHHHRSFRLTVQLALLQGDHYYI